jgi:hypothetical protein
MEKRFVTVDTGDTESTVFTLETKASAIEVLAPAMRLGYLTLPAGTFGRRGALEVTLERESHVLVSRLVALS